MTTPEELDELAGSYYLDPPADLWLEERVQAWILPWLAQQCRGRVLEMGWGTGIVARTLRLEGVKDLEVVEGSERLTAEAWRAGLTCSRAMFESFDPGPVFDTVVALHVLEHVENPVRMLEQIKGWLRPWGRVIVVTPNAQSFHRQLGQVMTGEPVDTLSARDRLVGHRRGFTMRQLQGDARAVGFRLVQEFGWFLKPVHNALMIDWPPELIDALCVLGFEGLSEDAANIGLVLELVGS